MTAHFGVNLPAQHTSWEALRGAACFVEDHGFDSVWTWDHFVPLQGDTKGPILEAWQVLAALGAVTKRVRLGTLVTGNTYRHPAVLANMVATLDHITNGRAILGLGAAWHEAEHNMYGIPFFTTGGKLSRMDEASALIRKLLDQPVADFQGKHYQLTNAICEPKPIQSRLPLLIGGGGERKTLATVARYADLWHTSASPEEFAHKLEVLGRHCADVGRDPGEIMPIATIRPFVCLRDSEADVQSWAREVESANGMTETPEFNAIRTADALVERLLDYWKVGVRGFIFYTLPPYDLETLERIARDVRPRFLKAIESVGR